MILFAKYNVDGEIKEGVMLRNKRYGQIFSLSLEERSVVVSRHRFEDDTENNLR
jgi:hypothetical protein